MRKGMGHTGYGYLSLVSDPFDLATWSQKNYCNFATLSREVDTNKNNTDPSRAVNRFVRKGMGHTAVFVT